MLRLLASLLAVLSIGCATPSPGPPAFVHALGVGHPLAGRIVDTQSGETIDPDALLDRLAAAPLVLVGEKHDNLDHHAIEAWLIERLAERGEGGRLRLVMEIFETRESREIAAYLDAHPGKVATLLQRFGWGRSDDAYAPLYLPVLEAAAARRVPILGGDLDEPTRKAIARGAAPPAPIAAALERPLPEAELEAMRERIQEAHCGHAPASLVDAMITVQRARDATLARSVEDAAAVGRVLLVAGGEHVRSDVGVPFYLGTPRRSLGLREVPQSGEPEPTAAQPFDFVWYTPRVDDEDPCERFRKQLETLGGEHP